jgi:ABC-2 type transport system ATP-binding protein
MTARTIGLKAAEAGIALFELTVKKVSLEEAFMELTRDSVEYHGTTTISGSAA